MVTCNSFDALKSPVAVQVSTKRKYADPVRVAVKEAGLVPVVFVQFIPLVDVCQRYLTPLICVLIPVAVKVTVLPTQPVDGPEIFAASGNPLQLTEEVPHAKYSPLVAKGAIVAVLVLVVFVLFAKNPVPVGFDLASHVPFKLVP